MKLQAKSSKALHVALQKAARCISRKNSIAILDNVLLSMKGEDFMFTSSSGDSQLTIPAPLSLVSGKFSMPLVFPAQDILALLGTLPDCVVFLDFDESTHGLVVEYCVGSDDNVKSGKASMTYQDGDEFPMMRVPTEDVTHIALPATSLLPVVNQSSNFIVADNLRPQMASLLIDVSEDLSQVTFASACAQTLMRAIVPNDPQRGGFDFYRGGNARRVMVHSQHLRVLSVFEGCELIDMETDGNNIHFSADGMEFICKLVDGTYPNVDSVIPKTPPYFIMFDKGEILSVVKRVSLFGSESSNAIELTKNGMFLNASARDLDFSTEAEDQVLIADANCEEGFHVCFNSKYLSDVISVIPTDTVKMCVVDSTRAVVFTTDEPSPRFLTLCMPILNNY